MIELKPFGVEIGERFGKLKVISGPTKDSDRGKKHLVECQCERKTRFFAKRSKLLSGEAKGCDRCMGLK